MSLLIIAIANIHFTVSCKDLPLLNETQPTSYKPFFTEKTLHDNGSLTIDVITEIKNFPSTEEMTEIFEDCGPWSMSKKDNEYYLVINPSLPDGPECIVYFKTPLEKAIVYCGDMNIVKMAGRNSVRNPFSYPLDQLLVMYALAERQGMLIHAAGLEFNGKGYIFPGKSGAGKSTISRQLSGTDDYEFLSDDRIILRKIDNTFKAFGTPWPGEAGIAVNKSVDLSGIFFISQANYNRIEEITPQKALERLLPVVSIPWYDKEVMIKILDFCENLISNVPVYELHFKPDIEVADVFRKFISEK